MQKGILSFCALLLFAGTAAAEEIKLSEGVVHVDCYKENRFFSATTHVRDKEDKHFRGTALNNGRAFTWSKFELKEDSLEIEAYWSNWPQSYHADWYYVTVTKLKEDSPLYKARIRTKEKRQWYVGQVEDSGSMDPYGEPEITHRDLGEFSCIIK